MKFRHLIILAVFFCGLAHSEGAEVVKAPQNWASLGFIEAGDIAPQALALDGKGLYIAYSDYSRDGKASVRTYTNNNWVLLGKAGFSLGIADNISLAFSKGQAYAAYRDAAVWGKAFFAQFKGEKWQLKPISRGEAFAPTLTLDKNGEPALSFRDESEEGRGILMQKMGEKWDQLGIFGKTFITSAVFGSNNTPYFAYEDYSAEKTAVLKLDGGIWKSLGSPSSGMVYGVKLAFDQSTGVLYAAFREERLNQRVSVARYDGYRWVTLGQAGFLQASEAWGLSLVASMGELYLPSLIPAENGAEAAVMQYKDGVWGKIGGGMLPPAAEDSAVSLACDGALYLAYRSSKDDILIFKWE